MAYSEKGYGPFCQPRNVGEMKDANGVGEVGNPKCGDIMRMYIKVENGVIQDVSFMTFGWGAAIATSSMATELIKGKTVEERAEAHQQSRYGSPGRAAAGEGTLLRPGGTGHQGRCGGLLQASGHRPHPLRGRDSRMRGECACEECNRGCLP